MNTVLIHLGCQGPHITGPEPPPHMEQAVRQYRLFNRGDLYVITDRANLPHVAGWPGVIPIAAEDYYTDKVDRFHVGYKYDRGEFWGVSTTRFFYLEEFVKRHKLVPLVHFENDVCIYFDVSKQANTLKRLYGPNLAYTPTDDTQATSGFVYVGSHAALAHFNAYVVDMIETYGMYGFEQKYEVHMMNDMTLLRRYADTRGAGATGFLPVLPFGEHSRGYETFGAIFDPGDYGQYFGGTRGQGPGVIYDGHIVGGVLRNRSCKLAWRAENGLRVPWLVYDGGEARFNSLHIHSKNLEPFKSDG